MNILRKPYTNRQRAEFISNNKGKKIVIENESIYAIELYEAFIDGVVVDNTKVYQQQIEKAEAERISNLYLTAADVERGIYNATGKDFDDLIALVIEQQPQDIDIKALKIELKANNFYRGNPYVDVVGGLLGFTKAQMDSFFETGDYTKLLKAER